MFFGDTVYFSSCYIIPFLVVLVINNKPQNIAIDGQLAQRRCCLE